MARMNFPKFEINEPKIDFKPDPINLDNLPEINSESVKTPTLLGAQRINLSEKPNTPNSHLEGLPLEERINLSKNLIIDAGKKNGIDPALAMSLVNAESSFNPNAISSDGHASKGLFQLLDKTGKTIIDRLGISKDYNPYDPKQNVEYGMNYLRYLHDVFSNDSQVTEKISSVAAANSDSLEKLAVAAFNAGEGRVASAQKRAKNAGNNPAEYSQVEPFLPRTTRAYVSKVIAERDNFAEKLKG
jgi:soluble lytic murein transglycosylase-like protein